MRRIRVFFLILMSVVLLVPAAAHASETTTYALGNDSLVNAGENTGYSETTPIDKDDPHWGWSIGRFYVDGFTRKTGDNEDPVFLKNAGDTVTLWFELTQDINCLNENDKLSITEDKKGWDQKLGILQQDFGRGTLIVKQTNHQNDEKTNTYVDFLSAASTEKANTKVQVFEEGDYEVALDYRIRKNNVNIFGWKPFPSYFDYRISFVFSVRNGNSMVFLRDAVTNSELSNTSFTENGFILDFAQSHYLNVDVRKSILNEESDDLIEDTRFNKPAADGQSYTDEGIYTITVTNQYTQEQTKKIIYVGDNDILKAYATTGIPIKDIERQVADGAIISEDGTLVQANAVAGNAQSQTEAHGESAATNTMQRNAILQLIGVMAIAVAAMVAIIVVLRRRHRVAVDNSDARSVWKPLDENEQHTRQNR